MTEITLHFEDEAVAVHSVSVSSMDNRCYAITSRPTGTQVLIDAADDVAALEELLTVTADSAAVPASLVAIATTHAHWDHTRALKELSEARGATTIAGADDAAAILAERGVTIVAAVGQGDVGNFAGFDLTAIHLRGHTPGSIAYVLERPSATVLFTGDSLFPGGVGNTGNDPERFTALLDDVERRLFEVYPDEALVLPGHGEPTTLGAERPHLGQWRARGW